MRSPVDGPTKIHRMVAAARNGDYPLVVGRMASGWLVMGEIQVVPGYCLLLPDPVVPHLNAMPVDARQRFLSDMAAAGDALLRSTDAVRINYEMLGNLEPALHAHLFPRRDSEPSELRTKPIWFFDWEHAPKYAETEHGPLRTALKHQLNPLWVAP